MKSPIEVNFAFSMAICISQNGPFEVGAIYPVVGSNNGLQVAYEDGAGETQYKAFFPHPDKDGGVIGLQDAETGEHVFNFVEATAIRFAKKGGEA